MSNADLQKAIDNLSITDVYLRHTLATCSEGFEPKYFGDFDSLSLQSMHNVAKSMVVEIDHEQRLLRIFIQLGLRWVDEKIDDPVDQVKAIIEAEYVAEYAIKETLEQNCIDEFAQRNASVHVWPYWRELLSNHCLRMELPKVVAPTMQLPHHRLDPEDQTLKVKPDASKAGKHHKPQSKHK